MPLFYWFLVTVVPVTVVPVTAVLVPVVLVPVVCVFRIFLKGTVPLLTIKAT